MKSWQNCPGNQSIKFFVEINTSAAVANKIFFSAHFEVAKKISGPLEFLIDNNRCDVAMEQCEKYPGYKFNELCQKLRNKNAFYSGALSSFLPPFVCPILPQKYFAPNSSIDLTVISTMPISGYVWNVALKIVSGEGVKRETVLCVMAEVKIMRVRGRRKT